MQFFIIIIWSIIVGLVLSLPIELSFKLATPLLPVVILFFALNPFLALMALLIFRPELELFRESGLIKFFSVVPVAFLFILLGIKRFSLCWNKMKFMYLFLFFAILSLIYSIEFMESIIHILRLISIISVYLITFNLIEKRDDAIKILYCFPLAMIIPIIIGLKQFLLGETYITESFMLERVEGLFTLANSFARFLFINLLAALPFLYYGKKRNFLLYFLLFSALAMTLLLKVRSVFVAMGIVFIIIIYYMPKIKRYIWIIIPSLLLISIPISLELFQNLIEPVTTKIYGGESFFWRWALWKQLFSNAFLKQPFFGFGIGTSLFVARTYTTFSTYPHNDYLRILIENGIVGFIFYFSFFISNLIYSYKRLKIEANRYFNLSSFLIIFTFLFMAAAANISYAITYFWYFFGFLAVVHKLDALEPST